jgi:hypothetical protein
MVAQTQSPIGLQPPPPLPNMPDVSSTLTNYLNTFALWCRRGFAAKLSNNTALPGILLQAANAPAGTTPNVWLLQVSQTGVIAVTQVPLGGGQP